MGSDRRRAEALRAASTVLERLNERIEAGMHRWGVEVPPETLA